MAGIDLRSSTSQSGASLTVQDEGSTAVAAASALNFVGSGVTASDGGSGTATVTIPGAAPVTLSTLLGWYSVKDAPYSAKGDGRTVTDAVTTSGSAVVTSATAAFTAADVGRSVQIQKPDGTTLATTTVLSRQSATQITLNANASASASGTWLAIGTDDTAAVQAAITAAHAAGGGTVFFPPGLYILAGAQQTGTVTGPGAYTGQLLIPQNLQTNGAIDLRLCGGMPAKGNDWGAPTLIQMPPDLTGGQAVLRTFATTGNVLSNVPNGSGAGNATFHNNVNLLVEDLYWRAPNNPQCTVIDGYNSIGVALKNVTVGVAAAATTVATPTGAAYGIKMPSVNNNTLSECRSTTVYGFPTGIFHSECTFLDDAHLQANVNGIEAGDAFYPSTYVKVISSWNQRHLFVSGQNGPIVINGMIEVESKGTNPPYQYDLFDQYQQLRGELRFVRYTGSGLKGRFLAASKKPRFSLVNLAGSADDFVPSRAPYRTFDDFSDGEDNIYALGKAISGQIWGTDFPVSGVFGISGGKGYLARGNQNEHQPAFFTNYHPTLNPLNYTVTLGLTTSGTRACIGAMVQHVDNGGNFIAAAIERNALNNQLTLYKVDGGVRTSLATALVGTITATTGYTVAVTVTPTQIVVAVGGTTQITYTKTGAEQTKFNAATDLAGVYGYAQTTNGDDGGSRLTSFSVV